MINQSTTILWEKSSCGQACDVELGSFDPKDHRSFNCFRNRMELDIDNSAAATT